ncbi:MAG TPA: hypothetical protein VFP93_03385 [Gammaproteobacteria bacterium]|nr:hypothetical protein [Gammaproteobacteria bacterium]
MQKIGILVSSPLEGRSFFKDLMYQEPYAFSKNIWVICAGRGDKNQKKATTKLIFKGIDGIISWGFAGGLDPTLASGTIILPQQIIHPFGPTLDMDKKWHKKLKNQLEKHFPVITHPLAYAQHILHTPKQKRNLFERTKAAAVDQESFIIGDMVKEAKLPFISLRVILDDAYTALPKNIQTLQDNTGTLIKKNIFLELLKPHLWLNYLTLSRQYSKTNQILHHVIDASFNHTFN